MTLHLTASTLFVTPSAEREPWLADVFVRLPNFEQLMEHESSVIYGTPGMGKTSLRLWAQQSAPKDTLIVFWAPVPADSVEPNTPLAQAALRQAIQALIEKIAQDEQISARLRESPVWVGMAITWFLRNYLPLEAAFYIQSQGTGLSPETSAWYLALLEKPAVSIFKPDSTQNDQLRMLMNILQLAGIQHVWWMVDGIEKWTPHAEPAIRALVEALLSTLAIFDVPRFVFKVFADEALKELLGKTSGVARDRLRPLKLSWGTATLTELVEKRLAHGLSQPNFQISSLCPDPDFYAWLCKYGGTNPRAWISLMRPFIEQFDKTKQPLSAPGWKAVARAYPPLLCLHPERQEARLSEHTASIDSADGFKILQYLNHHSGQLCSLEEIYFCGIKGLAKSPKLNEDGWEHKSIWRPALDTTISRLRKKMEWDSANPVYLVTHPRRGLELTNTIQMTSHAREV